MGERGLRGSGKARRGGTRRGGSDSGVEVSGAARRWEKKAPPVGRQLAVGGGHCWWGRGGAAVGKKSDPTVREEEENDLGLGIFFAPTVLINSEPI